MAYETEYTDFDPQEDSSACLTLGLATDIVESRYLRDFSTAEPEEKQQILKDLSTFLEQLLRQPQISGSADAWHNLAVNLARIGRAHHARHHGRRGVLDDLRDRRVADRERRDLGRRE